eukprot:TRINITY_DN107369_c0_g1_i1.p1 TRINITY_DN107369_c0_g1~~TRINITY_DN107369_c0_g1_i1.p1  ORF type:complete len:219 (-),score=23.20 TRINITY_DN107369_c0_g1_i1:276-932(-)
MQRAANERTKTRSVNNYIDILTKSVNAVERLQRPNADDPASYNPFAAALYSTPTHYNGGNDSNMLWELISALDKVHPEGPVFKDNSAIRNNLHRFHNDKGWSLERKINANNQTIPRVVWVLDQLAAAEGVAAFVEQWQPLIQAKVEGEETVASIRDKATQLFPLEAGGCNTVAEMLQQIYNQYTRLQQKHQQLQTRVTVAREALVPEIESDEETDPGG